MKSILKSVFLALILVANPLTHSLLAQDVLPVPMNKAFNPVDHSHLGHSHLGGQCLTLELLESPEGKAALEEFRQWNAMRKANPEMFESTQIQNSIGDRRNFFALDFATSQMTSLEFVLMGIGNITNIWVEATEISRITEEVAARIIEDTEDRTPAGSIDPGSGILANNRAFFGAAPNVDGSGKVNVLFHVIGNTQGGMGVGGYFTPTNLSMTNPNSNRSDIVYINANYFNSGNVNNAISAAIRTLAHEDQHLIHAAYGNLGTFQNEAQSEYSVALNGYPVRAATNLTLPAELNTFMFQWRNGVPETSYDYSRAGVFHEYVAQRLGTEKTGRITRSPFNGVNAYSHVSDPSDPTFAEIVFDFHTANIVNDPTISDGRFGYSNPFRRATRTSGFADIYPNVIGSASGEGSVFFGGAEVIHWPGVKDFSIQVSSSPELSHRVIGRVRNSEQHEIYEVASGLIALQGEYDAVYLLSVNNLGASNSNTRASYTYVADWDYLPLLSEELRYYQNSAFYAELPGDPTDDSRRAIKRYAYRFSPQVNGVVNRVTFRVNGGENAVVGSGILRISLHESIQSGFETEPSGVPRYVPGPLIAFVDREMNSFATGLNPVIPESENWPVERNKEYFVVFEVRDQTPDARLEFLIDGGSTTPTNTDYYPARSRIFLDNGGAGSWARWASYNNFLVDVTVSGEYDGPLAAPQLNVPNNISDRFFVGRNTAFSFTMEATGQPEPVFIWKRDGVNVPRNNASTLTIPAVADSDFGRYTVQAVNFAGRSEEFSFDLQLLPRSFALRPNYPNPFNNGTMIEYDVPHRGSVRIDVFDSVGRLVTTLVDLNAVDGGSYRVPFDARGLASGVYFYRMVFEPASQAAEGFVRSNKMLLLK